MSSLIPRSGLNTLAACIGGLGLCLGLSLDLCLGWAAAADDPTPAASPADAGPSLRDPFPFDHDDHAAAFKSAQVTCIDCHPLGLRIASDDGLVPVDATLDPPRSSCHACHQGELAHAPRSASSACSSCHGDRSELLPADHDADWLYQHGLEGRAFRRACADCHEARQCFDCHDDRGPSSQTPHPPAFRTTHGVEARLDPQGCTTCHTGATCTSCHASGVSGGWPW